MAEELTTVFRSGEHTAREEAETVFDLLTDGGFSPEIFDDEAPGVPQGVVEVRVPPAEADRADALIAQHADDPHGDPSESMDMETLYDGMGTTAEVEAMGIKALLDSNDIPNVLVGVTPYPSLRFLVRVPAKDLEQARKVVAEAEEAGPLGADEAELAGEQ